MKLCRVVETSAKCSGASKWNGRLGTGFARAARPTGLAALILCLGLPEGRCAAGAESAVDPAAMPAIGTVDERFQSYNIEMVEVTGGRFWKPYRHSRAAAGGSAWRNPFEARRPIDLANTRLRRLAAALSPAYLRVSGTWANSTYFADGDAEDARAPPGFASVLLRRRWRELIEFSNAAGARLAVSFAISAGTRDKAGNWQPDQARRLLAYTASLGGKIAAAEFMNEPSLAAQGGAAPGYDAASYARDFEIFRSLLKSTSPQTLILGPGSVGESGSVSFSPMGVEKLLAATGAGLDAVSYHYYATVSRRCGGKDRPQEMITDAQLARTDLSLAFYSALRDRFAPGKPMWLTETADAACGGNPWDATFLDSFRYLDQLGGWRDRASRSSCTIRWRRATMVCSTRRLLSRGQVTGRRCSGGS